MNDNKRKKINVAIKRYHKDDVSKITGLVLGIIAGGLAVAIGKVVQWARKARADKEREREYIEYIRTGKITESKYVSEIIYVIKRAINNYYLSGDLDPIFNRNGIVPSRRDAYIKRIKEDISKCKTLEQLNNYIETKTPFHSSHFDDLEYVTELFRKARTMRDSKSFKVITHDSMPWTKDVILSKRLKKKLSDDYYSAEGTKAFQKIYRLADKVLKELPKFGAKMFDQVGDNFLGSKGERGLELAEKALHRILGNAAYVTMDPGSIPLNAYRIKSDIKESLKGISTFESAESRTPETTKFKMILQTALNLI